MKPCTICSNYNADDICEDCLLRGELEMEQEIKIGDELASEIENDNNEAWNNLYR